MKRGAITATIIAAALSVSVSAQEPMSKFCAKLKQQTVTSDASLKWVQFGPGMSGNNKIAFWHPTDPNTLFISPNMGNSYRSTDGGKTYETILNEDEAGVNTNMRGPKGLNGIDFSRQNPDYGVCTSISYDGLYITEDRGKSWRWRSQKTFNKIYLSDICVDPKDDNVWYVGSGNLRNYGRLLFSQAKPHSATAHAGSLGMIWKSTDRGENWSLSNKGIDPSAEIETLLVDPKNSNIVYASTTYGFYISTDSGRSWKASNKGLNSVVLRSFSHYYDKATDQLTFVALAAVEWQPDGETITDKAGGVFRSLDRGKSWECINGDLAIDMTQFSKNKSIMKGYIHSGAYYFSMKDNDFASKYPKAPTSIMPNYNQIEVDPNDPNNIYIINMYANLFRGNFMPGQMWRTTDGGKHWFVAFRNGRNWESGGDIEYWKKRGNPTGNNVTFQYLDNWMNRYPYDPKSTNFARFNCDGTILHSQMSKISVFSYDKGDTWVDIDDVRLPGELKTFVGAGNSNLPGHGFYQDLRLPGQVFCAAGENSLWITREGGESVRPGAQAVSVHTFQDAEQSLSCYVIHPQDTTIRYAMFFRQHARGELLKSTDNGKTWKKHGVGVPEWEIKQHSGDQPSHQLNLMIDPNNPDNMYFCVPKSAKMNEYVGDSEAGFGVNRSTDGGATWSPCNTGLPKPFDVTAICFDPKDSNTLYATAQGVGGGLFKSINNGASWEEVKSTRKYKFEFGINDIHFDVDGRAYITSGHRRSEGGGAWVSEDGMKSWKMIFDFPYTFRIETAHYDPKIIMLSTLPSITNGSINAGTYLSKDGGKSWIKFNSGNGQSDRVNDIAIDNYTKNKFYASTYGSGWYVAQGK